MTLKDLYETIDPTIFDSIFLGCKCYTFEELFENIELMYDNEWIPFGKKFK